MDRTFLGARLTDAGAMFNVPALRATLAELWLYAALMDASPVLKIAMTADAAGICSATVPRQTLGEIGLATIYYGMRAWGPNWDDPVRGPPLGRRSIQSQRQSPGRRRRARS